MLNRYCRAYLVGSDSLFGGGLDHQLYSLMGCILGEKAEGKPRMAFSTSFGSWNPKQREYSLEEQYAGMLLKGFHSISVREPSGVDVLNNLFHIDAEWTLDPVLLADKESYQSIEESLLNLPEHYLFAYILQPTVEKIELVRCVSREVGLSVIFVPDMNKRNLMSCSNFRENLEDFCYYNEVDVEQWLFLMDHAERVITDSYHGMLFALIFETHFSILSPRDGLVRFETIADYLGIKEYVNIQNADELKQSIEKKIDFGVLHHRLSEKKKEDMIYFHEKIAELKAASNSALAQGDLEDVSDMIISPQAASFSCP